MRSFLLVCEESTLGRYSAGRSTTLVTTFHARWQCKMLHFTNVPHTPDGIELGARDSICLLLIHVTTLRTRWQCVMLHCLNQMIEILLDIYKIPTQMTVCKYILQHSAPECVYCYILQRFSPDGSE